MSLYFVDTSYLLALELSNDQSHQLAQRHWAQLITTNPQLVTTSYIFDEVVTYLNSRGHHQKAVEVGSMMLKSPSVQFIHVDESLLMAGWLYFQQHHDKRYSLTDCISFVIMKQQNILTALTFDHHFEQAGFQLPDFGSI